MRLFIALDLPRELREWVTERQEELKRFVARPGGCFSGPRMGVLWLGVEGGKDPLAQLAARLNECLEAEGFPKEARPFRGHVTLARSRNKISSALLKRFPLPPPCPEAWVDRLHLYQSILDSEGARYTRLHRVIMKDDRSAAFS